MPSAGGEEGAQPRLAPAARGGQCWGAPRLSPWLGFAAPRAFLAPKTLHTWWRGSLLILSPGTGCCHTLGCADCHSPVTLPAGTSWESVSGAFLRGWWQPIDELQKHEAACTPWGLLPQHHRGALGCCGVELPAGTRGEAAAEAPHSFCRLSIFLVPQ